MKLIHRELEGSLLALQILLAHADLALRAHDATGEIAISPDMAARLGKLCGNGAGLWLRLQANYDAWEATHRLRAELSKIPTIERA